MFLFQLQLSGNTGKRETQIPNPLRGNREITKEYKENFLMNLSNLLQSKVNHQEKQDKHTHTTNSQIHRRRHHPHHDFVSSPNNLYLLP